MCWRPRWPSRSEPRSSGWSDSAGARITDQVDLFPGRRGAGRIFYNQIRLSGQVPGVLPVRTQRSRRGVRSRVLRRCVHGGWQRVDVPWFAADGRDRRQRAGDARGDGWCAHAHGRVGMRRQPGRRRRRRRRPGTGLSHLLPPTLGRSPARLRAGSSGPDARRWRHPGRRADRLRHRSCDRHVGGRRQLLRDQARLRHGVDRGLRPPRRSTHRRGGQQPGTLGRRAVRRFSGQGGPVHLGV